MKNMKPRKVSDGASVLSWIITLILLGVNAFPLGLAALFSKLFANDLIGQFLTALFEGGSSSGSTGSTRTGAQSASSAYAYTPNSSSRSRAARAAAEGKPFEPQASAAPQPAQKNEKEKENDGIRHISRLKKLFFVLGWIILAIGILGSIRAIVGGAALWRILQWAAITLGGGAFLYTARTKDRKERLYQNCVKFASGKAYVDIKAIAAASGLKEKVMVRELDEMLERGYFPDTAYLDMSRNLLVIDREKAAEFAASVPGREEPEREEDKFDLLLKEMERACGRIRDRDMLEKAVQIRGLAAAIFHAVREDPEKQSQISSFLNYYFPTTLKLLDSYADFEDKGFQGEKLTQTKARIETTMDTIIAAYRKQLDNLYLPDALDVDTDIDVLETMLKRDGLSGSDFGIAEENTDETGASDVSPFGEGTPGTM